MEQQLADGAISCYEGCIPLEFRAVETRDSTEIVSNPEEFMGIVKRKGYGRGWHRMRAGWRQEKS